MAEEMMNQGTPAPMTEEEITALRTKIGKSHHTQKDWDQFQTQLEPAIMYTAIPVMLRMKKKYSKDGILMHGGALLVFTSEASCRNYLGRIGMGENTKYMSVREIPLTSVREAAVKHQKMAYVDINEPVNAKILGIDGRDGTLKVYNMKK